MLTNKKISCKNIILVGMMGSGKSTVGRALAKHLKLKFFDSDYEIEKRSGVSISHIFDVEGECGFRARESLVIEEILQQEGVVLATGGGSVLSEKNRAIISSRGLVIYLHAQVNELWQRTKHDKGRPLLQNKDPLGKLRELYDQRNNLYIQVADVVHQTGRQSVHNLVLQLQKELEEYESKMNFIEDAQQKIKVNLGDRSYNIHVGNGLADLCKLLVEHIPNKRVAIISNEIVAPLYLQKLQGELANSGIENVSVILPDGEKYKNIDTLNHIYNELLKNRCERSTPIIALGGGVVGDISGFAAATYLRGVPLLQIPTTLLSQVDSSVGGKTGINHELGKNMVGAFYQPQIVIADVNTLATLPDRELSAGLAEVIKYGLIRDISFMCWLEENMDALIMRDSGALTYAVTQSCKHKAEVVEADERESGERALLNLGHTFGHAIESGMGYGVWLHGEAVAAGTIMAADLSCRMGWLTAADVARVRNLFERAKLPVFSPNLGKEKYLNIMGMDKKVEGGKIRFVLLKSLGHAVIECEIPISKLHETLDACVKG